MMTLASLVLMTVLAADATAAPTPGAAERLMEDATRMLLEGRSLPRDTRLELLALEPADRIRVIAYLRRIGLMTGAPWPAADLLLAPSAAEEAME